LLTTLIVGFSGVDQLPAQVHEAEDQDRHAERVRDEQPRIHEQREERQRRQRHQPAPRRQIHRRAQEIILLRVILDADQDRQERHAIDHRQRREDEPRRRDDALHHAHVVGVRHAVFAPVRVRGGRRLAAGGGIRVFRGIIALGHKQLDPASELECRG